ncbi:unnamed protein product [Leptidea sinapis]|uniref:Uncharacterized protein n=1 Tax=Leptidea sinapis TaxID=189913 RepID=A0A5E4QB43_9NEOP|nr:unnamed protein product [Leptidea sinapis]
MAALDDLPQVHPMAYGCSIFIPISYLLVTIWILVALYFAISIVLLFGLQQGDAALCGIWVWYSVVFVVIMLMMMILLALVFTSRKQRMTIYFILVVNSHRKELLGL